MNSMKKKCMILACLPFIGPMIIIFWFGFWGQTGRMSKTKVGLYIFINVFAGIFGVLSMMILYFIISSNIDLSNEIINIGGLFSFAGAAVGLNTAALITLYYFSDYFEIY